MVQSIFFCFLLKLRCADHFKKLCLLDVTINEILFASWRQKSQISQNVQIKPNWLTPPVILVTAIIPTVMEKYILSHIFLMDLLNGQSFNYPSVIQLLFPYLRLLELYLL